MSEDIGRIHGDAYRGATGALFGIALVAYAFRLYVQIRVLKRFDSEDWVLLFSVAALIACTVFNFVNLGYTYTGLRLSLFGLSETSLAEVMREVPIQLKTDTVLLCLWWLTVCGVKLAYLLFFRKLVWRLKGLKRWWWVVLSFVVAGFIINVVLSSLTCPYSNITEIIAKCSQTTPHTRIPDIAIATSALDIFSDGLIVSIPVALLWRVRLGMRQKAGLATTLCLSTVMAIVGIIRVGGLQLPGSGAIDDIWTEFWLQQECSIAVTMVSLSASRALFVTGQQQEGGSEASGISRYLGKLGSALRSLLGMKKGQQPLGSTEDAEGYYNGPRSSGPSNGEGKTMIIRSTAPKIPSATMTGMRTAIDRAE